MSDAGNSALVPIAPLRTRLTTLHRANGATVEDASEATEPRREAGLSGRDSLGFMRTPKYVDSIERSEMKPRSRAAVIAEGLARTVGDGGWGFDQPAARLAVERARGAGVRHCRSHGKA
jgi:LDH2 family malate/lactate/ureidoglycolate dehydrogenase